MFNKLFVAKNIKVRDHDHVTKKYRCSAHWSCNINLKLTKKVPVISHNLKGYGSHLIMQEIGKSDVKIRAISNVLEKYMAFTINSNLIFYESMQFIDSIQFINFILDALVKNFSDNKYLSQKFSGNLLRLIKQKGIVSIWFYWQFRKFFWRWIT